MGARFDRMSWRAVVLVLALLAAACTSADDSAASPSTTLVDEGSYQLVAPDPDDTVIEPESAVRIGRLDNGLTYYVRSNQHPGSGLSLRLVVNAGSLQQDEPRSGAAHFLEHMLFNGTERFPGNELDRALQRIGVEIGPDLNAYTSFDETVYQLELSDLSDETVDLGFSVLSQWASAATIDEQATISERGVVREEVRLSDEGSAGELATAFDHAYSSGTAYEGREPGGNGEMILATTASELRTFYDRWYRPDLMAIIAVGDLSTDRLEQEIIDRFSNLEARADSPPREEPRIERRNSSIVRVVSHPDMSATFGSLDYAVPSWDGSTVGGERLEFMQDLYALMMQNRLHAAVDLGRVVLDDPWAGIFVENRNQRFLGFSYDATDLVAASRFVLTEVRRAELSGFSDAEYRRATSEIEAGLDQFLATAPTINDRLYADAYIAHFLEGAEISSVADTHERLIGHLRSITADDVSELFRWEIAGAAPILIVAGPDPVVLPSEDELNEAIDLAAKPRPLTDAVAAETTISELMARPDPVDPISSTALADVDGTEWEFANGVTVRFIPSSIATNEVELQAIGLGGWSVLSEEDSRFSPVAVEAVSLSGIGAHDRLTVRRFLARSTTFLAPFIAETTEGFVGFAGTDDLEVLLQQLHLSVTAPRLEEPAFRQAVENGEELRRLAENDAGIATRDALAELLFAGNGRFSLDPPALDSLTRERALDIYRQRFSTVDDLVVALVGDARTSDVADLAARYLGTLPAGPSGSWSDVRPGPLTDIARSEIVVGSGEATGAVAVLYPSEAEIDAVARIELRLLQGILNTRLFEEVREELGASYGGFIELQPRDSPTEGVDALFYANIDPDRSQEVLDVMVAEATDLAENGPTEDELERALTVLQADFDLISNPELIDMLLTEPDEDVLTYQRRTELLDAVVGGDLQARAATIFPSDVRAEVVALPG